MKIPTLHELVTNPKAREALTDSQLLKFIDQLKIQARGRGRPKGFIDNPADVALHLSEGRWKEARHLRYLSDMLVRLEKREIKRLMVSLPPRHGKSYLLDIWAALWWLTRHPRDHVVLASYGEVFARQWGGKVRDLVIEHSEYLNLDVKRDMMAADEWGLTSGGGMISTGAHGAITGRGADLLIIDDPIKNDEEANSETQREKIWNWWQATSQTRLEPNAVVVLVATRWHEDDLLGRIEKDEETKQDWTIVKIPALAEEGDVLGRMEGEPLWPERFFDDPLYEGKQRGLSPYWWSALYQQRPTPEGGGIILRDWWNFYTDLPKDCDQWIQSWDMALKDTETSDHTAGQVWARKGATLYLVDSVCGHFNLHQVADHMRTFARMYPQARAKAIEDSAMGPAIKQTLQHEVPGMIPIKPVGSKFSRVQAAIPFLRGGNVCLPELRDGTKKKWVWEFIEEHAAFDKGKYDDQVDAFSQAAFFLMPGGWRDEARRAREAPDDIVTSPQEMQQTWFQEKFVAPGKKRADTLFGEKRIRRPQMW
jgi:predicted phage terminase large subunit-like protein